MTIFDGVDISPTTPSTLHRVIPFGLLVLRTLYEAGKNRDRRLEAQAQGRELTSVREMMELAGVKLPDVRAAVAELLGGSAELAQAATLIAENPDLGTLLQKAAGFTAPQPAATEPIVTPPPTHEPRPVAPSPTSPPCSPPPPPAATMQPPSGGLAKFRPDFTREGREAARAAAAAAAPSPSNSTLPKSRPDLTREGREAATAAAASPPPRAPTAPATSAASPQASATADMSPPRAPAAPATNTSPPTNTATDVPPPQTPARPSLVAMVERQLAALVQAANANQAQIDERLRRAEAELAEVHAELRELIAQRHSRGAQVTQPPEEKQAPVQPSAEPAPTSVTEETPSTAPTAEPAATVVTSTTEPAATDATITNTTRPSSATPAPEPARLDGTPIALPTGATEEEVVQVVGMIGAVSEQLAAQHQKNLERVDTVQREVVAVKAIVAHLREAEGAPAHG
ncbi:MAG: hypothetical protein H6710_24610 [Myxococcales bacterium]|nr:hypothetical protein [Myxococcales bacterium]